MKALYLPLAECCVAFSLGIDTSRKCHVWGVSYQKWTHGGTREDPGKKKQRRPAETKLCAKDERSFQNRQSATLSQSIRCCLTSLCTNPALSSCLSKCDKQAAKYITTWLFSFSSPVFFPFNDALHRVLIHYFLASLSKPILFPRAPGFPRCITIAKF